MAQYKTLEKLFYADKTEARFENNEHEANKRLNFDAAFRTGIRLPIGELFFLVPPELSILTESVLRIERKISSIWKALPRVARFAYIRSLILNEMLETNEMEGVRSTRKQIINAIDKASKKEGHANEEQFVEFARLYLKLTDAETSHPKTPEDIRSMYDAIVEGTIDEDALPDGTLFRASGVDIVAGDGKTIHEGVTPEEKINSLLNDMIALVESDKCPLLYSSILSHFLFEYIHPFYDGNGRTGRYLLAQYLSVPLSLPTVLSLSKTIAEHKGQYYKAFEITEKKVNHGEATHFILILMELINSAQENLEASLMEKKDQLDRAHAAVKNLEEELILTPVEKNIMFDSVQLYLFGLESCFTIQDASEQIGLGQQTARKYLKSLEQKDLLVRVSKRPACFEMTDKAKKFCFL